jgi:hypothetical protein
MIMHLQHLIGHLQTEPESGNSDSPSIHCMQTTDERRNQFSLVRAKIMSIRDFLDASSEVTSKSITKLKESSNNPGSNYYWLIFVVLYVGVYLMQ